ncbi:MAG TPA: GNAT family N-acetyltransferase [Alphaproteobacteria bacterium]|nr:GNAT family N-acetyltransferase [Alphaproteobacteria bacterium]HNS43967.1 GNAT family N-acetyltransferase [Alphaproteobacteria bacterium]
MKVRTANLTDKDGIDELLGKTFPALMKSHYDPEVLQEALQFISKSRPELLSSGTYYVATDDQEKIIGCGGWTKENPDTKDVQTGTGHLRHFATHVDHTRQGIGRKIFEICQKQALNEKISKFECFSTINAKKFYASLGFKTISPMHAKLPSGLELPCVLMRMDLTP